MVEKFNDSNKIITAWKYLTFFALFLQHFVFVNRISIVLEKEKEKEKGHGVY